MAKSKIPSAAVTLRLPIGAGGAIVPDGSTPVARPREFTSVHQLRERFIHIGRIALNLRELSDFQHVGIATESQRHGEKQNL